MFRFVRWVYVVPLVIFAIFAFWLWAGIDVVGHVFSYLEYQFSMGCQKPTALRLRPPIFLVAGNYLGLIYDNSIPNGFQKNL
jgi:hypothetical protein